MAKNGRLELGDNIYGQYKSIFNNWDVFAQQRKRNWRKNAKLGLLLRLRSFKVNEVGTNRMPVCDFLLVINSNWHLISYRFGDIEAYSSHFGHFSFLSHPIRGLGTTYDVYLGLIGKRVVDFLLVIIEQFSLGVTVRRYDRISAISLQRGHFNQHFK